MKTYRNIIVFRNLKKVTDEAITLFSNKEAIEEIIMQPYEDYVNKFNEAFIGLLKVVPTVNSVNNLQSEEDELEFIKAFRELMRIKNTMVTFADFVWEDLAMNEQLFEDYKSKYLDLYDKVKNEHQVEKVSILEDVDFELELIHRDEVNVTYILKLLAALKDTTKADKERKQKEIVDLLTGEAIFKIRNEKGISFKNHIKINTFELEQEQTTAELHFDSLIKDFKIYFEELENFTLVYALEK